MSDDSEWHRNVLKRCLVKKKKMVAFFFNYLNNYIGKGGVELGHILMRLNSRVMKGQRSGIK